MPVVPAIWEAKVRGLLVSQEFQDQYKTNSWSNNFIAKVLFFKHKFDPQNPCKPKLSIVVHTCKCQTAQRDRQDSGPGDNTRSYCSLTSTHTYLHAQTHTHAYQKRNICVCVCVCEGGQGQGVKVVRFLSETYPAEFSPSFFSPTRCSNFFHLLAYNFFIY